MLVLNARGAELERDFVFGVVRQLFDHVVRDNDPATLFTGAARFAAPLLEVDVEGVRAAPPEDPFAARHALYWLTANLAADQPAVVLVDDGHWADAASLAFVAHMAHRAEEIAVTLVIAMRSEASGPALDAVRRVAGARATHIGVRPLGAEAAAVVVRGFAPEADDATCRACHSATGGNPFLLRELARSLAGATITPGRFAEQSPELVTREIAARLARLPDPAGRLAGAAAVLGGGVPLRQAGVLAGIEEQDLAESADALVAAGVLRSVNPVEFQHPLLRAAVYAGLGPAVRSRDHSRAAHLLADEAAGPERVAAQLLRCRPAADRWAYDRLVSAARLAALRGATEEAARYLRRALDEPAPPEEQPAILLELGSAEAHFDPEASIEHLRATLAADADLDQRFRATMLLTALLGHTWRAPEAADALEEQLDAFASRPDLQAKAEAAFANITRIDPTTRPRGARVIERLRRRVDAGDERDAAVLGTIAAEMGMAGEPVDRMAEIAAQAVAGMDATATGAEGWSWYNAVRSLVVAERYELALQRMDDVLDRARERGAVIDVGGVLTFRSELYLRIGDLANAEMDSRTLRQIATGYGWALGEGSAVAYLGEVLIERGELEEAAGVLTEGHWAGPAAGLPPVYPIVWVLLARGRLRLAQGRPEDAAEELRECGRRALALDHTSPAAVPWRSELARALTDLGRLGEANELIAEELERARTCGARRAIGIALRGAAHVEGRDVALLREAVEVLDPSGAELERAHAYADLGIALRRSGDAEGARDPLRQAVDLAHRCGAQALEDRALAELRGTGARPRRRVTTGAGALTPSERRIAELAAAGQMNREIAETLFVTTPTVEFHLRNAYRKLEIAGRTELVGALARKS
jgi:DNA-binding CsgD family transcriptional regulator